MRRKQLLGGVLEEVRLPNNQAYYDRLHDKIMARIEETELETPARPAARNLTKPARLIRDYLRSWR